jgi:hypothetical protein
LTATDTCIGFHETRFDVDAHRVTNMADTDIDAVRKQKNQITINNTD